ncbi:MAG: alpha/beta fold hydrolase [Candidatus Saccharibacteria bacterium]|nr:alpha/beta fold hydrolase [Moraxellaceae bacterium]
MPSPTPLHEPYCNLRKSVITQGDLIEGLAQLATTGVSRTTEFVQAFYREAFLRSVGLYKEENQTPLQKGVSDRSYSLIKFLMKHTGQYAANGLRILGRMSHEHAQKPLVPPLHMLVSALNGIMGDHLVYDCNPLALPMLVYDRHLKLFTGPLSGRVVILVHGLCMDMHSWYPSKYQSLGEQIHRQQDCTVLYLSYNTGRRISLNGQSFSKLLNDLVIKNPDISQLDIIGHSMGGLVSRSALFYGKQSGFNWIFLVDHLMCLGSPHQGALLERLGYMMIDKVGKIPFAGTVARLGDLRSAGIIDLRWGSIRDDDWEHLKSGRRGDFADNRRPAPLPSNIKAYFIAGTIERENIHSKTREAVGDYLVSVKSALGEHANPEYQLNVPQDRKVVFYGVDHMQLQYSQPVVDQVLTWLKPNVKQTHKITQPTQLVSVLVS